VTYKQIVRSPVIAQDALAAEVELRCRVDDVARQRPARRAIAGDVKVATHGLITCEGVGAVEPGEIRR
jgi:hypothetical protein